MTTVGIIYPGHAAEGDYAELSELLGHRAGFPIAHIAGEETSVVEELLDVGNADRLAAGAEQLRSFRPDSVVWAGTSGSFVFGVEGARAQVDQLARVGGAPASSASFAFLRAVSALGLHRVAIAASYPVDVTERFVEFLSMGGLRVVNVSSGGIRTAVEAASLGAADVVSLAATSDHSEADVVLIPNTAIRTVGLLPRLESAVGKPVLTANQVTAWEGLRMAGYGMACELAGALFSARCVARQRSV